ncbi:MAG: enoyl-CoA hydratase/isomerase family protein [Candidatus Heimdallarchaeota archaeon]|nr:MAG: enoyl-CoA hydratase/isomerase family protein [Candidatus Heimdallarchaeota archaeon]
MIREDINHVAIVTLNRPKVHNAFNPIMIEELTTIFKYLGNDTTIRAIVLTGEGKSFSAGADIKYMQESKDFSYEENHEDAHRLEQLFNTIYLTPKPVIGRINGAAFGGGIGLISVCDIVIAVKTAKMAFSEVNLGILPAVISPYVIPKIGFTNASRFFLSGERFNAIKAHEIGLIHELANDIPDLDQKIADILDQLFTSSPAAMASIKRLLVRNRDTEFQELRKYCISQIAELRTSDEGKEGLIAFLEKRPAEWNFSPWKGRDRTDDLSE